MRYQDAIFSFSSGVLSPRITLRSDSGRYDAALLSCKNFVITPQGGITFRNGTQFIGEPLDNTNIPRLFSIVNGGDISDVLVEMNAGTTRYWQDDTLVQDATPADLTNANPYSQADLDLVRSDSQEKVIVTTHPEHPPQFVTVNPGDGALARPIPFVLVPTQRFNDLKSTSTVSRTVVYDITFTSGWSNNDEFWFEYDGVINQSGGLEPLEIDYQFKTNTAQMVTVLEACAADNPILSQSVVSVVFVSGTTYQMTVTGETAGRGMRLYPQNSPQGVWDITASAGEVNTGEEPAWSFPNVVLNNTNYYQVTVAHESTTDTEPGVGADWADVWTDLGTTKPSWYDYQYPGGNTWLVATLYGIWDRGWPRTLTFHQERLWLGGTRDLPSGVWASRVGQYNDFVPGAGDDDPIAIILTTRGTPLIQWMESQKGLILGTSAGEYRITSDGAISPSNLNAEKQNNARSGFADAISIDYETFYIEQGRTKVRSTRYVREALGYVSNDVSLPAEHLFYRRAKRIVLTQTPEVSGWILMDDGNLVSLSYARAEQVAAWQEHTMQDAIKDIASIYSLTDEEDQVYFIAQRGTDYYIEKMPYPEREFTPYPDDSVYFDSWVYGVAGAIAGLDHLEGSTVGVTDNSAWVGEFTVSGGTVPYTPVGPWAVGLRYRGEAKTFERTSEQGVQFGTKRRWGKLYVRLLDSALPLVNGKRSPDRPQEGIMDFPTPIFSGDVKSISLGFNDGSITIEQDLPFPTHVLGAFGQFGMHNS